MLFVGEGVIVIESPGKNPRAFDDKRGLTLIEILIAIAIISILVSLAAVGPEFLRNENIAKTTRELLGDLQRIRQDAMTKSSSSDSMGYGIRFANSRSYTVFEFTDLNGDFKYEPGEEAGALTRNLTSSIVIEIGGAAPIDRVLIYDKRGIPRGIEWTLAQMTAVVKHEFSSSVQAKCVVVSTNRAREGLWNGSECREQ